VCVCLCLCLCVSVCVPSYTPSDSIHTIHHIPPFSLSLYIPPLPTPPTSKRTLIFTPTVTSLLSLSVLVYPTSSNPLQDEEKDDDAAARFTNLWVHAISQATVALLLRAVLAGLPRLSNKGLQQVGYAGLRRRERKGRRKGGM